MNTRCNIVKHQVAISGLLVLPLILLGFFVQAQSNAELDSGFIFLQLEAIELDGFSLADSNHSSDEAQRNPLEDNSSANMDVVLQSLDNVQLVKRGAYALDPQINTMNGGQIAVTIDGMRIFGACTDKMDPATSYIEPTNLKSAEVNCHAQSALEGSNIGGGLNLNLRKAMLNGDGKIHGELNSAWNSISNGWDINGGLNFGNRKMALRVNGAHRKHNSYRDGSGNTVNYTQYNKSNFSANGRMKMGKKWMLAGDYLFDRAEDVGFAALPMDVKLAQTHLAAISAKAYNWIDGVESLEFKAYYNEVFHEMDDSNRPIETIGMRMDMPGWSNTFGAFSKLKFNPLKKQHVQVKIDYYNNFRKAEMTMYDPDGGPDMYLLTWPEVERNALGFALVDKWELNPSLSINLGLRLEWINTEMQSEIGTKQFSIFGYENSEKQQHLPGSVSLGFDKALNATSLLSLTATRASRVPTTSELFGFYLFNKEDGYDYMGNPNLQNEQAWRMNLKFQKAYQKIKIEYGAQYSLVQDYIYGELNPDISPVTFGSNGVKFYDNVEGAHLFSANLVLTFKPLQYWKLSTNFNYNWAEQFNHRALPQIQPLTNRSSLSYTRKKYFGEIVVISAASQQRIDTNFGEGETASWAVMNVRVGYNKGLSKNRKLNLRGGIENLFNNQYHQHLDWGNVPRAGRNFYVNVAVHF